MRHSSCTNNGSLIRKSPSLPLNMANFESYKLSEQGNNQTPQNLHEHHTLSDFIHPIRIGALSCIVFPCEVSRFNFKSCIIQLLPTFHSFVYENQYLCLREFEEVCNTCIDQNYSMNIIILNFFLFSLKEKDKT